MPGTHFLRNVLLFSLAGLLPVLLLYVALSPGFTSALGDGGPSLERFLRQVVTNGLPVICAVNYVGFFLLALSCERHEQGRDPATYIVVDVVLRLGLFVGLHGLIYVASADWYGSFGGNRATAIQVMGPTLARSALFDNISGVYFFATFISAIPLYASATRRSERLAPIVRRLPKVGGPFAISFLISLTVAVGLSELASAISHATSHS
ncbi:hypothetical protein [Pseudaestuariivita sp.]|uniref:hypothetical protein n=1 Tax=Pseudaestuariivita sp. TaxID=2211669 RepID=UPI0040597E67